MMASWKAQYLVLASILVVGQFVTTTTGHASQSSSVADRSTTTTTASGSRSASWQLSESSTQERRSVAAENVAIEGLKILGLLTSVWKKLAPLNSIISVVQALLGKIFEAESGDPKHAMREIVMDERVSVQKNNMLGIRRVLLSIERENISDAAVARRSLDSLRVILLANHCHFMRRDNVRSSAAFFVEFATVHIAVSQLMIVAEPHVRSWPEDLQTYTKEYIAYAKYVIQEETKHNRLSAGEILQPEIEKWTRQLPTDMQQTVVTNGAIRNQEHVAFRLAPMSYWYHILSWIHDTNDRKWLNCWNKAYCNFWTCPNQENPMERGSQYQFHWKCRGEIFFLHRIDGNDSIIRTCDRVGIHYWDNMWFSMNKHNGEHWRTSECPGSSASSMRNGDRCVEEAFRVKVLGKGCGVPITDRDTVQLLNANTLIGTRPYFVIYRAGIDINDYSKGLPACS